MADHAQSTPLRRSGRERFHAAGSFIGPDLLGFWQWLGSDLLSNTLRGRLAEFIVGSALDMDASAIREEWAAYDLLSPEKIKVEVKSAAYVQSWSQQRHSIIRFSVRETRAPDEYARYPHPPRRQADVYVFALLAHKDRATIDPMDVCQWQFFVLPTARLNAIQPCPTSLSLGQVERLCSGGVSYSDLSPAVNAAADEGRATAAKELGSVVPIPPISLR